MGFQEVEVEQLSLNPFTAIGEQWMLVSAGDEEKCNTMTASWGGMGVLWGMPTVTVYLRPQRYTRTFVEAKGLFTVSFLGEEHREALAYCGRVSGREVPVKIEAAGLTPYYVDGTTAIEEAELVLVCRTIYSDEMPPENFVMKEADERWYPEHDYHRMFIGQIVRALRKEQED